MQANALDFVFLHSKSLDGVFLDDKTDVENSLKQKTHSGLRKNEYAVSISKF